jgi:3-phosphoshikimate 1-carboxyvinyltransferase
MTAYASYKTSELRGTVSVAGDKSISHRALMLSSQVLGTTEINGLLEGEDVLNTARALRQLGVNIEHVKTGHWRVHGVGVGGLKESPALLDMGNAGTGARLMMGLLAPYSFTSFFSGDASLCSRPMKRVMTPLEQMGAKFLTKSGGRMPLAMTGNADLKPIKYTLPVPSAQVKSAILLAGLNTAGKTTVIESEPTRNHTENMLAFLGFQLECHTLANGTIQISLEGKQDIAPKNRHISVPTDPSSAAFLVVAALITEGSELTIPNVCINPLRIGLFTTLKEMGAALEYKNERDVAGERIADIHVKSSTLKAVHVPAERAPSMIDEYPILAIAASFAEGTTVMNGLEELIVKESNRLAAIMDGLKACGVSCESDGKNLSVQGSKKVRGGGSIKTNLDHRICMSFLILGMASDQPVTIDDGAAIATSFPDFIDLCNMLGARIKPVQIVQNKPLVIAIDGLAASGKGTLGRRLAKHYGLQYLDTGSLYRAVGLKVLESGHQPQDKAAAIDAAKTITIEDLASPKLRQEEVGSAASVISAYAEVRAALLEFQREVARSERGAVLDGRDIGTVVCPDAPMKLYLTASLEARAKRRHKELSGQGFEIVYESVLEDLKERDERDAARAIAPMKPADDALTIDTSTMDANSVFEKAKAVLIGKKIRD